MYYLVCEKHYGGEKICLASKVYSVTHSSHVSHGSSTVSTASATHGYLTTVSVDVAASSNCNNINLI